ncbi:hypothetical protein NL676_000988 [Syzygium grande]|nr:hypothetical protein NL676_000988 [Syzygium grande]
MNVIDPFVVVVHNRFVSALITYLDHGLRHQVTLDLRAWHPPSCRHPSPLHRLLLPHLPYHRGCYLPRSLRDTLGNLRLVLAGVRIAFGMVKRSGDYGLEVEMAMDLAKLVVKEMNQRELKRAILRP